MSALTTWVLWRSVILACVVCQSRVRNPARLGRNGVTIGLPPTALQPSSSFATSLSPSLLLSSVCIIVVCRRCPRPAIEWLWHASMRLGYAGSRCRVLWCILPRSRAGVSHVGGANGRRVHRLRGFTPASMFVASSTSFGETVADIRGTFRDLDQWRRRDAMTRIGEVSDDKVKPTNTHLQAGR